jgi:hypothetical protein
MKGKTGLIIAVTLLVCAFSGAAGQANDALGKQQAFGPLHNLRNEDLRRKGLDICFSFDDRGNVSKLSIQSNQLDESGYPSMIKRETVEELIDDLVPDTEKGPKLWKIDNSYGRAYGESIGYQKVTVNLTMVCRKGNCGVSYAEIVWEKV